MRKIRKAVLGAVFLLAGCHHDSKFSESNPPYVLYRNPLTGAGRVHIATFDNPATDNDFNRDVCQADANMINKSGGDGFKWWCEKAEEISN